MNIKRNTNIFEKLLLLVGVAIAIIGFYLLNKVFSTAGRVFDVQMLSAVFLWLMLIFFMIVCAITENQREELGIIATDQAQEVRLMREETRLLKEISKEHLVEIKLLRQDLCKKSKK
jgi:hypothetical protein